MGERITIKIVPPEGGNGELPVQEAMRQVLDAFRLLTADDETVVWRLITASTNSPLTVVAEAEDGPIATEQKRTFAESLAELRAGRFPQAWKRPELAVAAASFLQRSAGLVARTEFQLDPVNQPIVITADDIAPFLGLPELPIDEGKPLWTPGYTKRQVGSIEGELIEVTTYRSRPAIRVRERKSNREITSVLSEDLALKFSVDSSVQDVWNHRRVTVRGIVYYQAAGQILRVDATAITVDEAVKRPLPPLRDPTFTGGLTAAEYLERFRAGELG